jgi:hypothetical protein
MSRGDHFYTTDPSGELAPSAGYDWETSPPAGTYLVCVKASSPNLVTTFTVP